MATKVEYIGDKKDDALVKTQLAQQRGKGQVPTKPKQASHEIAYFQTREAGRQKAGK